MIYGKEYFHAVIAFNELGTMKHLSGIYEDRSRAILAISGSLGESVHESYYKYVVIESVIANKLGDVAHDKEPDWFIWTGSVYQRCDPPEWGRHAFGFI